jgi:ferric-dicitrate binding protein FerR (iron transport regulator)
VAVTEGSVAVYRDGRNAVRGNLPEAPAKVAEATGGVALAAGEQVSVTRSKRVAKEKVNVDYELAWADGWLVYEDKTIAEVAGEFNRRNRIKIVVAEPTIAARRLAFFRGSATDPESFVAALAANSDIAIVRDDPEVLRVELNPGFDPAIDQGALEPNDSTDAPPSVNPNPI